MFFFLPRLFFFFLPYGTRDRLKITKRCGRPGGLRGRVCACHPALAAVPPRRGAPGESSERNGHWRLGLETPGAGGRLAKALDIFLEQMVIDGVTRRRRCAIVL